MIHASRLGQLLTLGVTCSNPILVGVGTFHRRGIDTRVGLEDTVLEPNGERTTGNAALVRAARATGAGAGGERRSPNA
jgi:hypothetical protein